MKKNSTPHLEIARLSFSLVALAALIGVGSVGSIGCNALSGIGDFNVDPTPEDGGDDAIDDGEATVGEDALGRIVDSGSRADSISTRETDDSDAGTDAGTVDSADDGDGGAIDMPSSTSKRIFTTSETYLPNLGGLVGADARCQGLADAAKLGGVYKAWLSDDKTSAKSRLTHATVPYVLVDGVTKVADGWLDLTSGALSHAIDMTEKKTTPPEGASLSGPRVVWTATQTSGAIGDLSPTGLPTSSCFDWTMSSSDADAGVYGYATVGHWDKAGAAWTSYASSACRAAKMPIYCVEQ